jgi:CRISPR-associated protein Csa2
MNGIFLSARGRVLINVEALNMTESIGNYVKHRRVPALLPEAGYATFFVPAISGESIAHGYQQVLAELGSKRKMPVCNLCSKGIFLKSTNRSVFASQFREKLEDYLKSGKKLDNTSAFERFVIENCIVEDIGGFLHAPGQQERFEKNEDGKLLVNLGLKKAKKAKKEKDSETGTEDKEEEETEVRNAKRTSNFFTGYMIPVREAIRSSIIEPQLHSRYALGTPFVERGQQGQMIYDVELSSAVYAFSFDVDTRFIGKTTYFYSDKGVEAVQDRKERGELALDAFEIFVKEMLFGAKKTRFLPVIDWESMVIAVSDDVWTSTSPFSINYLVNSLEKAEKFRPNSLKLYVYVNKELLSRISRGIAGIEVVTKELLEQVKNQLNKKKEDMKEVFSDQHNIIEEKFAALTQDVLRNLIEKEVQRLVEEKVSRDVGNEEILAELKRFSERVEKCAKTDNEKNEGHEEATKAITGNLVNVFDTLEGAVSDAVKYAKELQVKPA